MPAPQMVNKVELTLKFFPTEDTLPIPCGVDFFDMCVPFERRVERSTTRVHWTSQQFQPKIGVYKNYNLQYRIFFNLNIHFAERGQKSSRIRLLPWGTVTTQRSCVTV